MRLVFTPQAWEDYTYWQHADRAVLKRVSRLVDAAVRDPTGGIGKPESLKYGVSNAWSRRSDDGPWSREEIAPVEGQGMRWTPISTPATVAAASDPVQSCPSLVEHV